MEVLYVLNLAAALLLLFAPAWFSMRYLRLPALNPLTILLAVSLPVQLMKLYGGPLLLIDDGLFDTGYQFSVLMGNLLVVAQTTGTVFFYKLFVSGRIERYVPFRKLVLTQHDLRRAELVFLFAYLLAIYLLASAEFGVLNWIANPRVGYQLYRTGQGHWFALAVSMISVAMTLSGLANPKPSQLIRSGLLYLCVGYLLGSKTILLATFTMTVVFLWFVRWRHLNKLLLLGGPLVFLLLVWNLYLAISDAFDLQAVVAYFDYYKNAADYYREYLSGRLGLFHGEVAATSLWGYAPRALFPEKPVVYGILLVNEIFYPGQAELTNTPAFGGAVEQFADFGVAGVAIYGFFGLQSLTTAMLSYLIFRRPGINFKRVTLAAALALLIQFSPGFGTFFPGLLYVALLFAVAIAILQLRRKRRRRRARLLISPSVSEA